MCGGATVFHVLRSFGIRCTDRVGVIGVGGPDHLAIQFASRMGCEVIVFSGTESKKEEAMKLSAKKFIATQGQDKVYIDKLLGHPLITTSMPLEWKKFIPLMAPKGVIYPVTVGDDYLQISYKRIIDLELRVQGSMVAPRQVHREMIEFAALHGIRPIIEEFPLTVEGITEAMDRLSAGKMRYRGVLAVE